MALLCADRIMFWFRAKSQASNGIVEGFKNKAKLATGKS